MKKCFLNWNKDTVHDAVIFKHLYELSDGGIDITTHDLELTDSSKLMNAKSRQNTNKPHSNKSYSKSHRSSNKSTNRKRY